MSCVHKLLSTFLTDRLMIVAPLHHQQFACRPGRSALNALQNIPTWQPQRTCTREGTFVCPFQADQAYDSITHDLLLYRLLHNGCCGKALRAVDRMHTAADSADWLRPWPGHLRADDLAATAAEAPGLQQAIDIAQSIALNGAGRVTYPRRW